MQGVVVLGDIANPSLQVNDHYALIVLKARLKQLWMKTMVLAMLLWR